jgi:hypothetical protein
MIYVYSGGSLHNNISEKNRYCGINICLLDVDATCFDLYIGSSSGVSTQKLVLELHFNKIFINVVSYKLHIHNMNNHYNFIKVRDIVDWTSLFIRIPK